MEKTLRFLFFLCLLIYVGNFLFFPNWIPPKDFDHLAGYFETAWRFWSTGLSVPHYNPYLEGGRSLAGDPQTFLFSPWTLFVPLIGSVAVVKTQMLFELALGLWGLWKLLEHFGLPTPNRYCSLFAYLAGGGVVSKLNTGHVTLGFYFLYPLLYWFQLQFKTFAQLRSPRFLGFAIVMAYALNHKPNLIIYGLPPLVFEAAIRSVLQRKWVPIVFLGMATAVASALNAAWLLPSYTYFSHFPRHDFDEFIPIPLSTYFLNLLLPLRTIPNGWYGPRFLQRHEYNQFLGPLTLLLAFWGWKPFFAKFRLESLALVCSAILCVFIGLGTDTPHFTYYPFSWFISWWPGFNSIRVPTRFWFMSYFVLTVLAGFGFRTFQVKWKTTLFYSFLLCPLFVSASVNLTKTSMLAERNLSTVTRLFPEEIIWVENAPDWSAEALKEGKAVLTTVSNMAVFKSPLVHAGNALSFQSSAPGNLQARWENWNTVSVAFDSAFESTVSLNLNSHPYWKYVGTGELLGHVRENRLTLKFPSGHSEGRLVFTQPMSIEGLIFSALSLLVFFAYAFWILKSQNKTKIIGLTGGVASGKSQAAETFKELGIPLFNMDLIGRDLIESDSQVQRELIRICGDSICRPDGTIDRLKVREILFNNYQKKVEIEEVLHPRIWKRFNQQLSELPNKPPFVLCEAALFIESGRMSRLNGGLIVIMANEETRRQRLLKRDGITPDLAEKMIRSQATDSQRRQTATVLLENNGTLEEFKEKVAALAKRLKETGEL